MNCGDVTTENCTYFDSSSPRAGACSVMICPCNDNICQVRDLSGRIKEHMLMDILVNSHVP